MLKKLILILTFLLIVSSSFSQSTLLNIQYQIINGDPDLSMDDIIKCNGEGLFGHSHREFIETWEVYLENIQVWNSKTDRQKDKPDFDITLKTFNKIKREIEKCYKYHTNHFTLNDII